MERIGTPNTNTSVVQATVFFVRQNCGICVIVYPPYL